MSGNFLYPCDISNNNVLDHIADVSNMVELGSGAQRNVEYKYTKYMWMEFLDAKSKGETVFSKALLSVIV
ncbi:MAG TPA: hypothetical protein VIK86_03120 [Candidatus Paceibacterota bacterium]